MSPSEQLAAMQVVYLVVGGILLALGLPLYLGKVPPNRWYGFRIRETLNDPKTWRVVNRTAGGWLMVLGAAGAGVATWTQRQGFDVADAAMINMGVFLCGMAMMLVHCRAKLRRKS